MLNFRGTWRTVRIGETWRSAAYHCHCVVPGGEGGGFRKSGRQCCRFLDSHSQTGKELAEINRRLAAVTNSDGVILSFSLQLIENFQGVWIWVVKRTGNFVIEIESWSNEMRSRSCFNSAKFNKLKSNRFLLLENIKLLLLITQWLRTVRWIRATLLVLVFVDTAKLDRKWCNKAFSLSPSPSKLLMWMKSHQ